jgi:hypothetical protein
MFNSITNSIISNLFLLYINVYKENKGQDLGGLAARITNSHIENVHITGNIRGHMMVGGLIGNLGNYSQIRNSSFLGNIYGYIFVGGIVGATSRNTEIDNVIFDGKITTIGGIAGGIAGQVNFNSIVMNSSSSGVIYDINDRGHIGGITGGLHDGSIIQNSFSSIFINPNKQ